MSSREIILAALKNNKPEATPLPEIPGFDSPSQDQLTGFVAKLKEIDCAVALLEAQTLDQVIRQHYPEAQRIFSQVNDCHLGNIPVDTVSRPQDLLPMDLAILYGQLGVAENGAIWVTEQEMVHRVSPFITEHLVLVLDRNQIVDNMHQAYGKIKIDATGFGVFIAGPSKTADIEQSLVVGAQAARSVLVVLV